MKNYFIPFTSFLPIASRRFALVLLLPVAALWSNPVQAAPDANDAGLRLLKAQLPNGTDLQQTDCELLSRAVSRATVAHRADAPAILSAALTNGNPDDTLRKEDKRSCECVGRIVRASVKAAPTQASAVLDVAVALYPDCADALAAVLAQATKDLAAYDFKDARYPGVGSYAPVAGINNVGAAGDPASFSGFGAGFGPGSPGSPGSPSFTGSDPSGGLALPTPAGTEVTRVVNE